MTIDQTERHVMENRGTRHTLIIKRVNSQDFGNYSCAAENQLGKTKKIITLSGRPRAALFRSNTQSQWKDKYNITWTVDSHAPIEEYKLYYKFVGHGENDEHGVNNHLEPSYPNKDDDIYNRHMLTANSVSWLIFLDKVWWFV